MRCTQLSADVGNHFHKLLFGQQPVLHRLRQTANGFHRVNNFSCRLCRLICSRSVFFDNIGQSGNLAGRPCHALFNFRLCVADNVE